MVLDLVFYDSLFLSSSRITVGDMGIREMCVLFTTVQDNKWHWDGMPRTFVEWVKIIYLESIFHDKLY